MKRVLCITAGMNAGGAETFLMKLYRNLDRTRYQMDFCVVSRENYYAEEIRKMGGSLYFIPLKSKYPVQSFLAIRDLVRSCQFDAVMRVNEHSLSVLDLLAAKSGGARRLVMRSSNASSGSSFKTILHKIFRVLPQRVPDVKLAPSLLAAEYTFGKKSVARKEVCLLNNGLNIEEFRFSQSSRDFCRSRLGIQDQLVIGHVGGFRIQKNHDFLIDIFYEIQKNDPDAVLLLVGNGELQENIVKKVGKLGLQNKCKFLGVQKEISKLLSAMDLFIFPSFYEGMPNTVIEAQTSGLPCLVSDSITREVQVTPLVQMMSLRNRASAWAELALDMVHENHGKREAAAEMMRQKGYDIRDCTDYFVKLVFSENTVGE